MRLSEIQSMTDEELKELAQEKGWRGNASADAWLAQRELCERHEIVAGYHRAGLHRLSDEEKEEYQ